MNRNRIQLQIALGLGAVAVLLLLWPSGPAYAARSGDLFQGNPFALPPGVHYQARKGEAVEPPQEKKETKAPELPPLTLQAVVWGGPRPVAVINDENFLVGDTLFGHEIIDIGRDEVVLMVNKKSRTLRLEPLPLKVDRTLP
ncbi:hypothetical protein [Nitrospina gracilis]|uniref:hypothetical protein n=1 Tax=Nitrospina gracilis TaxID=35801 RepID=UPI001F2C1CEB|nr:hypothetical protein [Nitrospina gracilis]MCF8721533.1 hypothetical protein [Nitrospina gracilis Nb-211]